MIEIQNLNKKFSTNKTDYFHVLKNISLNIEDGELLVLKGISGSGKSTLLSIIAGMMKPTSGFVMVDGENIASLSDYHISSYRNSKVGFITQSFHLFDELSVEDNITVPLIITGLSNEQVNQQLLRVMNLCNISHKAKQKVSTLSGGEKQRTIIARALINEPKIIICDEPTANLDYHNSINFIEIVTQLKELNKTIIIATHDPIFDTLEAVDKMVFISDGSLE